MNGGDDEKRGGSRGRRKDDEVAKEFVRVLGAISDLRKNMDSSNIEMKEHFKTELTEFRETLNSNQRELKKVLFGEDGTGGMARTLIDLESTVCGIKDSSDDRGIVGDVRDIRACISGDKGLVAKVAGMGTEIEVIKTKQRIWNFSISGGSLLAIVKSFLT